MLHRKQSPFVGEIKWQDNHLRIGEFHVLFFVNSRIWNDGVPPYTNKPKNLSNNGIAAITKMKTTTNRMSSSSQMDFQAATQWNCLHLPWNLQEKLHKNT